MQTFLIAAAVLSVERVFYVLISRRPELLRRGPVSMDPVRIVQVAFYGFKVLQLIVFVWWCQVFGQGVLWPGHLSPAVIAGGITLIGIGQTLSTLVFVRLGPIGAFYGAEFGHAVKPVRAFPFSWFRHPQYVGAALTIWGIFLLLRFPEPDWIVLPALESIYFAIGARLERAGPHMQDREPGTVTVFQGAIHGGPAHRAPRIDPLTSVRDE